MKRKQWMAILLSVSLAMLATVPASAALTLRMQYPETQRELVNPYIGNVTWASSGKNQEQPFTLVYANLLWADFEPEEGVYDFDAFEIKNNFAMWRAEGKHLILRFVLDVPADNAHQDIPAWLLRKIGNDGQKYSVSYGRGFSPNYANPELILAHAKAIEALGRHYGQDPFIAYVQLGSLGHWGEWHLHEDLKPLPNEPIRDQYITPYVTAFPLAKLMMRRPFTAARTYNMGLFNDTSGHWDQTQTWLEWIEKGGTYDHTGEENALVAMPDAWKTAPIGGELVTRYDQEDLLHEDMLEETMELFELSHTSWMGPRSFVDIDRDDEDQRTLDGVMRRIGYRIRVAQSVVSVADNGDLDMELIWENTGIAPFYFPWQPILRLSGNGGEKMVPLELDITSLLPGEPLTTQVSIARSDLPSGSIRALLGIVNPATGEAGIALAMDTPRDNQWYELFTLDAWE